MKLIKYTEFTLSFQMYKLLFKILQVNIFIKILITTLLLLRCSATVAIALLITRAKHRWWKKSLSGTERSLS